MKNVHNVFPINIVVNMRDWTKTGLCDLGSATVQDNNNSSGDEQRLRSRPVIHCIYSFVGSR